uniref:Uncharacterized protein LOC114326986 n=1 Tax=Diabrotica virgifera virgifera TaxID=50390 RepID=A0A6P7F6B0_DIAVI
MTNKIWARSEDGTIDYISLTKEYVPGALNVLRKSFYREESDCLAAGVANSEDAMCEVDNFMTNMAKHGVSIVAVERKTNTVCGVAVNEIREINTHPVVTHCVDKARHTATKSFLKYVEEADDLLSIFENCKVDCYIELFCLSILPEYRRRGIALTLAKATEELTRQLSHGKPVKQSLDDSDLPLEPIPKMIAVIFTTHGSKRLGEKVGWESTRSLKMSFTKDDTDCFNVMFKKMSNSKV